MRSSKLWLLAGAAAVAACVVSNFGLLPVSAEDQALPKLQPVSEDTIRTVEVMRRVLVREGMYTRTPDAPGEQPAAAQGAGASTVLGRFWTTGTHGYASEAYAVPGQGAVFLLRTSDPVAPARWDSAATPPDKVWEEETAVLDGKLQADQRRRAGQPYDPTKVDALRARLLDALGTYGHRIQGLQQSDRLTVIVIGGSAGSDYRVVNRDGTAKAAAQDLAALSTYGALGTRSEDRTVLTISVALVDCQSMAGKTPPSPEQLQQFRRKAIVSAY